MPMLGDLLAAARRSSGGFMPLLEATDPALADRIAAAAARMGTGPTAYVRAAVADFDRHASEEDWATLTSRLRGSDDPGTACLHTMLDWQLATQPTGPATLEVSS